MSSTLTILYLESDSTIKEVIIEFLHKVLGHRVFYTGTTAGAESFLKAHHFDLVILTHSVSNKQANVRALARTIMEDKKIPLIVICNGSTELFPDVPVVIEKPMLLQSLRSAIDETMVSVGK